MLFWSIQFRVHLMTHNSAVKDDKCRSAIRLKVRTIRLQREMSLSLNNETIVMIIHLNNTFTLCLFTRNLSIVDAFRGFSSAIIRARLADIWLFLKSVRTDITKLLSLHENRGPTKLEHVSRVFWYINSRMYRGKTLFRFVPPLPFSRKVFVRRAPSCGITCFVEFRFIDTQQIDRIAMRSFRSPILANVLNGTQCVRLQKTVVKSHMAKHSKMQYN